MAIAQFLTRIWFSFGATRGAALTSRGFAEAAVNQAAVLDATAELMLVNLDDEIESFGVCLMP